MTMPEPLLARREKCLTQREKYGICGDRVNELRRQGLN